MAMPPERAASLDAKGINPSIDLHTLVDCLNQAIPTFSTSNKKLHTKPLFNCHTEHKALAINVDTDAWKLLNYIRRCRLFFAF